MTVKRASTADVACPTQHELADFSHGRLSEENSLAIAQHVSVCTLCQKTLEALSGQVPLTGGTPVRGDSTRQQPPASPDDVPDTELFFAIGRCLAGRYEIRSFLGEGGTGRVLLAYDVQLARSVALKLPSFSHAVSAATIAGLLHEARMAAGLRHPGIVTIYDVAEGDRDPCYIVMEYVDGASLHRALAGGRLPLRRAVEIVAQAADAVHFAHQRGIVHRDLKPSNLLIEKSGRVRVADFGMALHEDQQSERAGELAGTPHYMAPEQVRGEVGHLDGRADIWALGVIFYELLTGRRPFKGDRRRVFEEILDREPRPPRQIDDSLPAELEAICLRCLAKESIERYTTARDLADGLRRWLRSTGDDRGRPPRRVAVWSTALAVLLLVVTLAAVWAPGRTPAPGDGDALATTRSRGRAIRPFRWHFLLETEPEAMFPATHLHERWIYDRERQDVLMDSPAFSMLGLGETDAKSFKLQVGISKNALIGGSGLFLGYQPSPNANGAQKWILQMIFVSSSTGQRIALKRELAELEVLADGTFGVSRRVVGAAPLGTMAELREGTLEVVVQSGHITEVRWRGDVLTELADRAVEIPGPAPACTGRFGLINFFGSATFSNARLMVL